MTTASRSRLVWIHDDSTTVKMVKACMAPPARKAIDRAESFCNHGCTVIVNSTKGFKGWQVGLGLVVALFLFGALRAAINLKKETNEVVQASATPAVKEKAFDTPTAMPVQEGAAGAAAASMTPTATPVEQQPTATPSPVATTKPTVTRVERP